MKINAIHIDLNSAMLRPETIRTMLRAAADAGRNAVLWELEDKIRWESCPDVPHPDAMSKDAFRALLAESRALGLEPIPLLQTFGHAEYVLSKERRRSMRELPEFPDCYCASSPDARAFLRALAAEYRELFGPLRLFHFGGDEAYRFGSCPLCSRRDRFELYAEHLLDVTAETRAAGVRVLIWDDMVRHEPARLAAALSPGEVALCHWEYGPWPEGPDAFAPPTDFSKAAELAAHGFDVAVCGAASCWGDDPFLPRWARHAPNLVSARAAGAPLLGSIDTSWTVRLVPKRLQLPLFAPDPAAALARELPGLAPDAALSALRRVSQWEADWQHFLGIGWNGLKDSSPPPPGLFAQRAAERPEILARLRAGAAALRAAVGAAAAEIAAAHPDAAPDSFAAVLLEGAALKCGLVRALEGAAGAGPALPAEELAALRARTEAYYARETTPATAARAAEIVWGVFGSPAGAGGNAVAGVVVRGHGVASGGAGDPRFPCGTVAMQIPFFRALGLDLSGLHPGTVNVDCSPLSFRPGPGARLFERVKWHPEMPPETFSFARATLVRGGARHPAWIYYPHPETKPEHFQPGGVAEVIAPLVPGLAYGDRVLLETTPDQAVWEREGSAP